MFDSTEKSLFSLSNLLRFTGIFSIIAGVLYILVQFIHPVDGLASVETGEWVIVALITSVMSLFSVIGVTGIYALQSGKAGWLGLIGFILFIGFWILSMIYGFIEAFVLPELVKLAPVYVDGFSRIFGDGVTEVSLGIFPALSQIAGVMYLLGGLLFGIATYRAKVFPKWSGVLLAFGAVITIAQAFTPAPYYRLLAIPMGLAFMWLGYDVLKSK